ncbi:MAG: ABC transporter permease [Betaproteobacteria bacterium]|nr:ABC transporter permease [Betaproteobacteria bacterium]
MITTIAAKELRAQFCAPMAWIILAVLELVLAWFFLNQIDAFLAVQTQLASYANPPGVTELIVAPLFGNAAMILLMAVPLLSMRLIAGERRAKTLTLLLGAPVSITEIVLGKFVGLMVFLILFIGLATLMSLSLYAGATLDLGLLASNVIGLVLLAASFAALGLFISSLTAHPIIAGIGSLGAFLGLWIVNLSAHEPDSWLHILSLLKHFESFNRGVIASADVAFFVLFTAAFLVLAVRRLDADRLQG